MVVSNPVASVKSLSALRVADEAVLSASSVGFKRHWQQSSQDAKTSLRSLITVAFALTTAAGTGVVARVEGSVEVSARIRAVAPAGCHLS